MSDPRYVVAAVHPHPEWPELTQLYRVLDLPDAEHIHVTRLPDGTIKSAVPMVPLTVNACFMGGSTDCRLGGAPTAWVDSA